MKVKWEVGMVGVNENGLRRRAKRSRSPFKGAVPDWSYPGNYGHLLFQVRKVYKTPTLTPHPKVEAWPHFKGEVPDGYTKVNSHGDFCTIVSWHLTVFKDGEVISFESKTEHGVLLEALEAAK